MKYIVNKILELNPQFDEDAERNDGLISPIPRGYTESGTPIYEDNPSMGARLMEDGEIIFKDLTDESGVGYNELSLIKELEEVDAKLARDISSNFRPNPEREKDIQKYKESLQNFTEIDKQTILDKYRFSQKVTEDLGLSKVGYDTFSLPVVWDGQILAIRHYNSNPNEGFPKMYTSKGVKGSLVVNFDYWRNRVVNGEPTLICEGEKDMLSALSNGFSAICFTSGANGKPEQQAKYFKNKDFIIAYDNDETGIKASKKLAMWLIDKGANSVKVLTGHHSVCVDKGGDITDFFLKYNKTAQDLQELIDNTEFFTMTEYEKEKDRQHPLVVLNEAFNPEWRNKDIQSIVQVKSSYDSVYSIPDLASADFELTMVRHGLTNDYIPDRRTKKGKKKDLEDFLGSVEEPETTEIPRFLFRARTLKVKFRYINEADKLSFLTGVQKQMQNMKDLMYWVVEETDMPVLTYIKELTEEMHKEAENYKDVAVYGAPETTFEIKNIKRYSDASVYLVDVEQAVNEWDTNNSVSASIPVTAYINNFKPITGKKYRIRHKMIANPINSEVVCMIQEAIPIEKYLDNFELSREQIAQLSVFKPQSGESVSQRADREFNIMKNFIGAKLRRDVYFTQNLTYMSPLKIPYNGTLKKATLDAAIVGDAGIGKSYTFTHLQELYQCGSIVSSENATAIAIIGGSAKTGNTMKTTVGSLAKNDKGLIMFEEFTLLGKEIMGQLNEVRSSGKMTISRINGDVAYNAFCRYLWVANPLNGMKVSECNTGMDIIYNMFSTPQERRRFTYVLVAETEKDNLTIDDYNPFNTEKELDASKDIYKLKAQWAWSRKPEDIIISREVSAVAYDCAMKWWKEYFTNSEGLFGVDRMDTCFKIIQIAASMAINQFSTEDGKKVIVSKEHVLWAYDFWKSIYDNEVFNIRGYVNDLEKVTKVTDESIEQLQNWYDTNPGFITGLSKVSTQLSKATIEATYGQKGDLVDNIISNMLAKGFLTQSDNKYSLTPKFKATYKLVSTGATPKVVAKETKEESKVEALDNAWDF